MAAQRWEDGNNKFYYKDKEAEPAPAAPYKEKEVEEEAEPCPTDENTCVHSPRWKKQKLDEEKLEEEEDSFMVPAGRDEEESFARPPEEIPDSNGTVDLLSDDDDRDKKLAVPEQQKLSLSALSDASTVNSEDEVDEVKDDEVKDDVMVDPPLEEEQEDVAKTLTAFGNEIAMKEPRHKRRQLEPYEPQNQIEDLSDYELEEEWVQEPTATKVFGTHGWPTSTIRDCNVPIAGSEMSRTTNGG